MAHTTDRATLILFSHPRLVPAVRAITAAAEATAENADVLYWAQQLLDRFPAKVQHAAAARRVIVSRKLTVMSSVRAAQRKKYGEGGQAAPVSALLEALGDAPSDVLRVIVEFVGEGGDCAGQRGENESGEQEGGRKRGREE